MVQDFLNVLKVAIGCISLAVLGANHGNDITSGRVLDVDGSERPWPFIATAPQCPHGSSRTLTLLIKVRCSQKVSSQRTRHQLIGLL